MPTGIEEGAVASGGSLLLLNQIANALLYLNDLFPPLKYLVAVAALEGAGFSIKIGIIDFSVGNFIFGFISFITSSLVGIEVEFYTFRFLCYLMLVLVFIREFKIISTVPNRGAHNAY